MRFVILSKGSSSKISLPSSPLQLQPQPQPQSEDKTNVNRLLAKSILKVHHALERWKAITTMGAIQPMTG